MKILIILMLIFSFTAYSQVGRVTKVTKGLFKLTSDGVVELKIGSTLNIGDKIKSIRAQGEITFNDSSKIIISRNTKLIISRYFLEKDRRIVLLTLKSGNIKVEVPKKYNRNSFKIKTKLVTIAVKGTTFAISKSEMNGVELNVMEGEVIVKSNFKKFSDIEIKTNQTLTILDENSTPNIVGMDTMKLRALKIEYNINTDDKKNITKKFKNISDKDAIKKADKYVSKMRVILQTAFRSLKKARKEKNLLKINCVNDNVMTIKGYLRRSEDNRTEMESDKKKKILTLLGKIYSAFGNSKQAAVAIKSCSGDILTVAGDKNINLEIDDIDAKPYDEEVPFTDVVINPVPVSPFF